jgi:small-conductance mechanosensitive channel
MKLCTMAVGTNHGGSTRWYETDVEIDDDTPEDEIESVARAVLQEQLSAPGVAFTALLHVQPDAPPEARIYKVTAKLSAEVGVDFTTTVAAFDEHDADNRFEDRLAKGKYSSEIAELVRRALDETTGEPVFTTIDILTADIELEP